MSTPSIPAGLTERPIQDPQPHTASTVSSALPTGLTERTIEQPPVPQEQPSVPQSVEIPESDKGVVAGVERGIGGLISLPSNLWHAATEPAQDADEAATVGALSAHMSPQMALLLHRVIVAPMIREHQTALAYEKIAQAEGDRTGMSARQEDYDKDPKGMAKKDLKLMAERTLAGPAGGLFVGDPTSEAQHNANMHHIASIVPLLGPYASSIVEHYNQGDTSGGVSELLTTLGLGAIAHTLGSKVVPKLAPKSINIEGGEVPILASQAGSRGASAAEAVAKLSGKLGERNLAKFTGSQAEQIDNALARMAGRSADATKLPEINPLMMSAEDVAKATDVRSALAKSNSFGEAADNIKAAVNDHFRMIDEATGGEFNKLQTERAAIRKALRNPLGPTEDLQSKLVDVESKTNKLFDENGIGQGRTGLDEARQALAKSYALEDLDDVVHRATKETFSAVGKPANTTIQGSRLLRELNKIDPKRLQLALGGADQVQSIKTLAGLLDSAQNVTKMSQVAKLVQAGKLLPHAHYLGGVAASEAGSLLLSKILTSPRIASAVSTSLRVGANAPAIVSAIAQADQPSQ